MAEHGSRVKVTVKEERELASSYVKNCGFDSRRNSLRRHRGLLTRAVAKSDLFEKIPLATVWRKKL